jgi:hypothetical protein
MPSPTTGVFDNNGRLITGDSSLQIPINGDPGVVGSSTWNSNPPPNWRELLGDGPTYFPPQETGGWDGWPQDGDDWRGLDLSDPGLLTNGGVFGGGYSGGYYGGGNTSMITLGGGTSHLGGGQQTGPFAPGMGQMVGGLAAGGLTLAGLLGMAGGSGSGGAQRNLSTELGGILGLSPLAALQNVQTQQALNPQLTQLNQNNFGGALAGIAPGLREAYNAANPGLTAYTQQLGGELSRINAQGTPRVTPAGYTATQSAGVNAGPAAQASFAPAQFTSAGPAAQASFNPAEASTANFTGANASTAAQQRASGGPLLGRLQGDAMANLGRVSALQGQQEQIAQGLLNQGGDLSAQDLRNVQQSARTAYSARGLGSSNQSIATEVLNTDAARRARLRENLGIAQGVDAAGQQQIGQNRNYALGAQNQQQGLNTFNASQGNSLAATNAGLLTTASLHNSTQANDISRFNAGLLTQNSQFNSGLGAQVSLANMGARNNMAQFDASGQNQLAASNAGLGAQVGLANMGAQNNLAQFGAGLAQQNNQYNAGSQNQAQQFNVGAANQMGLANAQLGLQGANDQWARAMGLGNFHLGQAQNPGPFAMGLLGQAPDYTSALLGYGSDLNNTNSNAQSAANISRQNNNAALTAAGLNALLALYGNG